MTADMDMDNMDNMDNMDDGDQHMDHNGAVKTGAHITATLVIHLILLCVSLGFILPYGFACKQAGRSRRHLIVQLSGALLAGLGVLLGFFTGIGWYNPWFANLGAFFSFGVVGGSLLLFIYVPKGVLSHIKTAIDRIHTAASVVQPLVSWVLVGLSVISLLGFCGSDGDHVGQCLAHGIMGTAFVTYGIILLAMMYIGENFLRATNRSQEFYDSTVITIWGIINTFTEHRWGQDWNHGDIQHTSMGIVWWAVGLVGIYLSWDRVNQRPQRNHIPAIIIILTGYAMLTHTQHLPVSTKIHFMFGVFLTLAGLCRIIEISFVVKDQPVTGMQPKSFQFLTPFLMIESGLMFMSATEEAMQFLHEKKIMPAPYVLMMTSFAGLVFLGALFIIQSYIVMRRSPQLGGYHNPDSQYKEGEDGIEMPVYGETSREDDLELGPGDFSVSD